MENETEWHRSWKDQFPVDWQEVIQATESGERHIADVKTDQDWVLGFQHSNIQPEERDAREAFYRKIVWIVDGARREKDKADFFKEWQNGDLVDKSLSIRRIRFQVSPRYCEIGPGEACPSCSISRGATSREVPNLRFLNSYGITSP